MFRHLLIGLLLVMSLGAPSIASAQEAARDARHAAELARQRHPGKVLSVKRVDGHYQVKILHEGKVNYVTIKAQ